MTAAVQTYDVIHAISSVLSTELNSLTNGTSSAVGTAVDNSTDLAIYGMLQLDVTFGTAPTADTTVDVFLVPAPDGTNYNDGGVGVQPQNFAIGSFNMRAVNTQQLLSIWGILIPPTKFKFMVYNNTNRAFPASGSTVKFLSYAFQSN